MSPRPAGPAPVVSFEDVSKVYGRLRAVDGLSLQLRRGETVAFLGPNGAGKSTSLDMLLALRKPTSGRIRMFGSDPYHAVKSGRVGAMLQSGGLMPEVTVRELVTLVTGSHPRPLPAAAKAAGRPPPALCPRINLHLEAGDLDQDRRRTGVGSLPQVLRDLEELATLGSEYVVFDTYRGRPEDYRPAEEDWRMLEAVAARCLQ